MFTHEKSSPPSTAPHWNLFDCFGSLDTANHPHESLPYSFHPPPPICDCTSTSKALKDGDKELPSAAVTFSSDRFKDKAANSLDTAIGFTDKLITLVHLPRHPCKCIAGGPRSHKLGPIPRVSASMFFSFQLISNPDQPGASLFCANIRKALLTLNLIRNTPVADKALDILHALTPLYSQEFANEDDTKRERQKGRVLSLVKTLAFPYHDSLKYSRVHAVNLPKCDGQW